MQESRRLAVLTVTAEDGIEHHVTAALAERMKAECARPCVAADDKLRIEIQATLITGGADVSVTAFVEP